jgi:hypothetical protein
MPAIPTSGTDPVILALESLSPEALSRCIVGLVFPLLEVARHEGVDDVVRETMKKRYPEGGLFAIFDGLRAGLPVENAAATIKQNRRDTGSSASRRFCFAERSWAGGPAPASPGGGRVCIRPAGREGYT